MPSHEFAVILAVCERWHDGPLERERERDSLNMRSETAELDDEFLTESPE